jgi:hypothetical protein
MNRPIDMAESPLHTEHEPNLDSQNRPLRLFVIMPFKKEFRDVYILGIRDVAERLGMKVERADDLEHNEGVLDVILERIRMCDVVVADTTGQNPNVFYELGHSHAIGRKTIIISRRGQGLPFDIRHKNHVFYDTIVDLRQKLARRLRAILFSAST